MMNTEKALAEIDLYEQYIQMYIQVLPFVFDKQQDDRLTIKEIPTFEDFKVRYPFHYQHRVYEVRIGNKFIPIETAAKTHNGAIFFIPDIPRTIDVNEFRSAVVFAGKKINHKIYNNER